MPELPEVETVKRGLTRLIVGLEIEAVTNDTPKSFPNPASDVRAFLVGAQILDVQRRAKVLIIGLSSGYSLIIHLKMTGQLVFIGASSGKRSSGSPSSSIVTEQPTRFGAGHPNESLVGALPDRSTRVVITFTDASHLYFNDQRKFGWVRLMPSPEIMELDFFKRVGPEPLANDFGWQDFKIRLMRRSRSAIKPVLLDQSVIAGVGNIYADESLWGARIHPATIVSDLSAIIVHRLYDALIAVLRLSIEKGGSTNRNYVDAEGKKGSYMHFANVFRREGQSCPRCGTMIIKMRLAGRGTHICPHCQIR